MAIGDEPELAPRFERVGRCFDESSTEFGLVGAAFVERRIADDRVVAARQSQEDTQ